jgi:hypothetical protein
MDMRVDDRNVIVAGRLRRRTAGRKRQRRRSAADECAAIASLQKMFWLVHAQSLQLLILVMVVGALFAPRSSAIW